MLNEPTIDRLRALRMTAMAAAWEEQQRNPDIQAMTFDERFGLLVEAEWVARETKRVGRTLREAKLRLSQACLEGVEFGPSRGLDKAVVRQLGTSGWVREHQSILISGMTGTGKTYLACAFAHQACRQGYRALYRRAPRLFDELRLARADGTYHRLLARLAKLDVLVIDDFAISPVTELERRDLLEILEDRHETRSTIVASQLDPKHWHAYLGDPTVADAICDRVLHKAHRIALKGRTRRGPEPDAP